MLRGVREAGEGAGCPGTWVLASWATEPHGSDPTVATLFRDCGEWGRDQRDDRTTDQPRPVVACLVDHGRGFTI